MKIQVYSFKIFQNRYFPFNFKTPGFEILDFNNDKKFDADCFLQVNVKKEKTKNVIEYDFIKESQKPVLVCESNIFRKNSYPPENPDKSFYRLGWNHFLRQGIFNNKNCPPDRWNMIRKTQQLEIKDWRKQNGHILLCLQKIGDSTLNSLYSKFNNYEAWLDYTIKLIRKHTDRPILIRPHPKGIKKIQIDQFLNKNISISTNWESAKEFEGGEGLLEDFKNSYAVISYNSNVLVESICEGIPSIPLSEESVIWDISHKIEDIENLNLNIDRTQWFYNSAYMLWSMDEINNGAAWDHLKPVYFKEEQQ